MQYEDGKNYIKKENAYEILKAFSKEYKKRNGETPVEIVIVGGGSILLNYGFRDFTQDFDVLINSIGDFKDIIYKVADDYNLPNDWMNTDFKRTVSFSDKLRQVSSHYCDFNHGSVEIRTVKDEYLIAMKMMSARGYRNDKSDIIGILIYAWKDGRHITFDQIEAALELLYGKSKEKISCGLLQSVAEYTSKDMAGLCMIYMDAKSTEDEVKTEITSIDQNYPGVVNEDSVDNIVDAIRKRKGR